jgi:glycolate oxidase
VAAISDLRSIPGLRLLTDPDLIGAYRQDQATFLAAGQAAAVAIPQTAGEVARCIEIAGRHGMAVVPRGAGSGLSGGANAIDGCLVLCTTGMNRIIAIDSENLLAVVEPGVINTDLKHAAAEFGLTYPPDPASQAFSTIGGNIATNAGGLCCVRYGVTREWVLGLQVAMVDGRLYRIGRRTLKGVTGYDLTSLFVGSEGTLGVVTEATLRLTPALPKPPTVMAFFPNLSSAGAAIAAIRQRLVPTLLELMDRTTINAVEAWKSLGLDTECAALLIAQVEDVDFFSRACLEAGASSIIATADEAEAQMVLEARRLAFPALERQGHVLLDDVCVPTSQIPKLIAGVEAIAAKHDLLIATFGHAGDGNMHPTIVFQKEDQSRVMLAFDQILTTALELGGTVTGEHGVGILKRAYLNADLGESHRLNLTVKAAFDPLGIMNPGKGI